MWSDDHKVERCMSQLGARFREAREAHGMSLSEAAASTRILPRYLQALEDGNFEQLPGDVYARGFIRNYAQFLDVPPDELMLLYRRERGTPTDKIQVVPAAIPPRTRSCFLPSAFFAFFSIMVLIGVLFWVLNATGLTRQSAVAGIELTSTATVLPPTEFPTTPPLPSGASLSALPQTPIPTSDPNAPVPTPSPSPGASASAPPQAPLVVEVRIAPDAPQGSWLTISEDGVSKFTGIMLATSTRTFTAQREVYIHAGDASVVELIVNGENRGRMGTVRGGVLKRTIPAPNPTGSTQ